MQGWSVKNLIADKAHAVMHEVAGLRCGSIGRDDFGMRISPWPFLLLLAELRFRRQANRWIGANGNVRPGTDQVLGAEVEGARTERWGPKAAGAYVRLD